MEKSNRIRLINFEFGDSYKFAKESNQKNDLLLFVNVVNNLVKAIREIEALEIESPIIHIAFTEKYHQEIEKIRQLEGSLKNRGMI